MSFEIECVTEFAAGPAPDEWDRVLAGSAADALILSRPFQEAWWCTFCCNPSASCQLALLLLREGGTLVGVAPFYLSTVDEAGWDVLDLQSLPAASATSARCAASAHGAVWCGVEETCPVLALPAAWDDYLAALGKKDRHELRRKLRRAESHPEPLTWRTVNKGPELAAALETFIALHRRSDEAKARFMTPIMVTFFHRLLAAFAPTGWLEVATLYAGDHPVAAYLSFRQAARLLLYNSGYDPRYGGYSAGFALLVYRIRLAIEEGVQTFDFLRGDERYKYDLGAQDQFIYRVIIRK
jgi:CelD/BcsL family acetyltransferase involved in cellulose biosynthesis